MGVVSVVTPDKKEVSLRTDTGDIYGAIADESSQVLRIAPGERDMSKAEKITFTDIAVGDRMMIRGEVTDATKTVIAKTLVVMSKASIAARQTKEQEEWKTKSLAGIVKSVDAGTREITLTTRGPKEWKVSAAPADCAPAAS